MAQSPWPPHCLIVINLLESHYLGTLIIDDCDSEAGKAGYIFKTSEVSTVKSHILLVLYKPLDIGLGVLWTQFGVRVTFARFRAYCRVCTAVL